MSNKKFLTEEHKKKIGKRSKEMWQREGFREKMSKKCKGRILSESHKMKIGIANSISCKGKIIPLEVRKKMSFSHLGKKQTIEHRKHTSIATTKLWENLEFRKKNSAIIKVAQNIPEIRIKHSESAKAMWEKPEYRKHHSASENSVVVKEKRRSAAINLWKDENFAKKVSLKLQNKPNKKEILLNNLLQNNFPDEWKFVGDGYTWIAGKNPDYLNINGKKVIIELLGCYWHGCPAHYPNGKYKDDSESLVEHYNEYGFKCIVIWEHELLNKDFVLTKITNAIYRKA